jgi:hypothetical protein
MKLEIKVKKIEKMFNGDTINITNNEIEVNRNDNQVIKNSNNSKSIINEGDKFDATNSVIINKSLLEKSFSNIKDQLGKDTANVLKEIADIVQKSNNNETKELFNTFNEELNKQKPKKSVLKSIWNGLVSFLPVLNSTASIAVNVLKIIS